MTEWINLLDDGDLKTILKRLSFKSTIYYLEFDAFLKKIRGVEAPNGNMLPLSDIKNAYDLYLAEPVFTFDSVPTYSNGNRRTYGNTYTIPAGTTYTISASSSSSNYDYYYTTTT